MSIAVLRTWLSQYRGARGSADAMGADIRTSISRRTCCWARNMRRRSSGVSRPMLHPREPPFTRYVISMTARSTALQMGATRLSSVRRGRRGCHPNDDQCEGGNHEHEYEGPGKPPL